jgi:hypothetical protein
MKILYITFISTLLRMKVEVGKISYIIEDLSVFFVKKNVMGLQGKSIFILTISTCRFNTRILSDANVFCYLFSSLLDLLILS